MDIDQLIEQVAGAAKIDRALVGLAPEGTNAQLSITCYALANERRQSPAEIAVQIAHDLGNSDLIELVRAEGPYVNISIKAQTLGQLMQAASSSLPGKDQEVMVEYGDPNPFKAMHIGHLYTSIVGESIARMREFCGQSVYRINYGGDVGLHVARAMWGVARELGFSDYSNPSIYDALVKSAGDTNADRAKWVSRCYSSGAQADVDSSPEHDQIVAYNKQVYQLHKDNDHDSTFAKIYWLCREWCYKAFDDFFVHMGIKYDETVPESSIAQIGLDAVSGQIGKVYEEDAGAVIFRGDDYGLHNRVFINSAGLPTYETKDIGLALYKSQHYPRAQESIIITAKEQAEYFKVMLKSLEQFKPKVANMTKNIPHGVVKLAGGVKMSSRTGDVLYASTLIEQTQEAFKKHRPDSPDEVVDSMSMAAYKFGFLSSNPREDTSYDPDSTTSAKGKSGPYLLYSYARAHSILAKVQALDQSEFTGGFDQAEAELAWRIAVYPQVVSRASAQSDPSQICSYAYDLAKAFSIFYENNRVVGSDRQQVRQQILMAYTQVLASALGLLGISALDSV